MYEKLFTPGYIGKCKIKNRLVMSPMGTNLAGIDGTPTDAMIRYYEERAMGGCGLIYTEVCRVNDVHGAAMLTQLSLTRDRNIAAMGKLTSTIHKYGTKIFCQLHHPGRETVTMLTGGQPVVSASAVPCKFMKQETRALETEEVESLVQDFVNAAVRAQKAGFDGVEVHAAHGYLVGQFFSPYTNKRTDKYGGSFENRCRFAKEIVEGIHAACGEDYPVTIRISADELLDWNGETEDYIHTEDGAKIAVAMEKAGVAAVNVSCSIYETGVASIDPTAFESGWKSSIIKPVKDAVKIPVIAVNTVKDPEFAEKLLEDGIQDFVAMGRAWLADPQWGTKAYEGRSCDIRKCIGCLNCFDILMANASAGMPFKCAVNPRLGKENEYKDIKFDEKHHKVAVIGGGPAGLCAALTAAERGMKVTLFEKENELGGLVRYASASPKKGNMHWIIDWYAKEIEKAGVDVRLGTEASVDLLKGIEPDAIIVASGAAPIVPSKIPGVSGSSVYTFADVLGGKSGIENKNVLIAGAGVTGLECASYLNARGCRTTIIDMLDTVAPNDIPTIVGADCAELNKKGTVFMLRHALKSIENGRGATLTDLNAGTDVFFPCDAVVMALGIKPEDGIVEELKKHFKNVHAVGGVANAAGRIPGATNEAFDCVSSLFEEPKPSFYISDMDEVKRCGMSNDMNCQEGVYFSYLTDPAAIRKVLPPDLDPIGMPVVNLSICHVNKPSFTDDYYETILGILCECQGMPGMYLQALMLGGPGCEEATAAGRDNAGMPKKIGAEFVMRRDGDNVTVKVSRKGTEIISAKMELGECNTPLFDQLNSNPEPGKQVFGGCYMYHFDSLCNEEGEHIYTNCALMGNLSEYHYKTWEPGFAELEVKSSKDDPWGCLPVRSVIGGAYCTNDLIVHNLTYIKPVDAETIMPYLLTGFYDRTMFGELGRF